MTMRAQVMSGIKWTAGAKICGQLCTWAFTLIVMRLLSPADYGLLAMATVFVAFLLMMAEAGLGPALVQKEQLEQSQLGQVFGIVILVNLFLLLLLNLLAPAIAQFFREPRLVSILRVLSLQFVITAWAVIPEAMLSRQLRFKALSLIDLSTTIAGTGVTVLLAWLNYGVWALVFGSMLSRFARAVSLIAVAQLGVRPSASLSGMRRMLRFGGNVTSARLLSFFFNQADVVIVGRFLGNDLLGLYSVAMHVASLPVQRVSSILNQVTFPVVSRFQHDKLNVSDFVMRATRSLSLLAFPVLWGISSTAREFTEGILGPRWDGAALPLQLLSLMMPVRMVVNFLPAATDALGRPDLGLQNVVLAAVVMPPAFLVGSHWGLVGVACAWLFVYPFVLLFNTRRMLRLIDLDVYDVIKVVTPSVGCAAAMYGAVRVTAMLLSHVSDHTVKLISMVSTGIVVYAILTLAVNRQAYRDVLSVFKQPIKA